MKQRISNVVRHLITLTPGLLVTFALAQARAVEISVTAEADAELNEMNGAGDATDGTLLDSTPHELLLRTRSNSTPRHRFAMVRFPVDSLTGMTVTDATLQLTPTFTKTTGFKIVYYGLREDDSLIGGLDWDENTVTYNTAPGLFPDGVVPTDELVATHQILDMVPFSSGTGGEGIVATYMGQDDANIAPTVNVQGDWSYNDTRFTDFISEAVAGGDESITLLLHMTRGNSTTYGFYSQNATLAVAGGGFLGGEALPEDFKPTLQVTAFPFIAPTITIDRDTGGITLNNVGVPDLDIQGYSITSSLGALDQTGWKSIADNYDVDGPNTADGGTMIGTIDSDDAWLKLTDGGSFTDLSEFQFAGDGGTIPGSGSVVLSEGGAWIRSINETDLEAQVTLADGSTVNVDISYTGNSGEAFDRSDLNFDGDINAADWIVFRDNNPGDLGASTIAQGYALGDLDLDGDNDSADWLLFRADYNTANGEGAFATMLQSVPEPSTLVMLSLASVGLCFGRFFRHGLAMGLVCLLSAIVATDAEAVTPVYAEADAEVNEMFNSGGGLVVDGSQVDASPESLFFRTRSQGGAPPAHARHELFLLRFPITSFSGVTNATLNLTAQRETSAKQVRVYGLFEDDSLVGGLDWDETTLTYDTAPGLFPDGFDVVTEDVNNGTNAHQYTDMIPFADGNNTSNMVATYFGAPTFTGDLNDPGAYTVPNITDFINTAIDQGDDSITLIVQGTGGTSGTSHRLYSKDATVISATGNGFTQGATLPQEFKPHLQITTISEAPRLMVNPITGEMKFTNPTATPIQFAQYQIDSPLSGLLTGDLDWNSLSDQNLDPVGGGDDPGETWDESGNSSADSLAELFLLGSTTLNQGDAVSFGDAFNTGIADQDLTFEYHDVVADEIVSAFVEYLVVGDMDGNGTLDDADVNPFVQALTDRAAYVAAHPGLDADILGDFNGNHRLDLGDVSAFKAAVSSAGEGAFGGSNVPEPTSLALVAFALLGLAPGGRSLRRSC